MSGWQWGQLCGRGVDNLTVWHNKDFGHCFEQLVFVCGSHAILTILSAFYLSHSVYRLQGLQLSQPWPINIRFGVSLLFVLCPVVQMSLTAAWLKVRLSMMDIIAGCLVCLAWLLHATFLWRLRRMNHLPLQGPLVVVLAYLLTLASIVIQTRTVTLHILNHSEYLNMVEACTTYVMAGLHLCYILTLLPCKRPGYHEGSLSVQSLNYDRIETDPLLSSEHRHRVYGSDTELTSDDQLGAGEDANCFSRLFFHWVQPLMSKGYKGRISGADDLFDLPPRLKTERIEQTFSDVMNVRSILDENLEISRNSVDQRLASLQELPDVAIVTNQNTLPTGNSSNISSNKPTLTLLQALHKVFGCEYYSVGILKLLSDMLGFAGPILLNLLVSFIENKVEQVWHGYLYAGGLCGSTFLASMLSSHFNYLVQMIILKIRAAVISTIYHKSLVVNSVSLSQFSTGEVVNFMSTDTDRIVNFCPSFHLFWSLPFQIAVSLYLLHQQVGLAFLAGLGFAVLLIPVNRWLAIKIGKLSTAMMTQKDGRVKLMNEMLCGVRVIKFYTWEEHFTHRINNLRQAELSSLKGRKYLDAMCVYFWATTPVLISILTFTTYALLGHKLTAAKVFTSLALFNMLIGPLNAFPWVINGLMEAWVSLKRVHNFLQLRELDWNHYYCSSADKAQNEHGSEFAVSIDNGTFSWSSENPSAQKAENIDDIESSRAVEDRNLKLSNITLNIEKGHFIGVIGKVGSGKSSLLTAILAEMNREGGQIEVSDLADGFGLVSQEAWIQHASVKDNILFGKDFNPYRYETVIDACALRPDLKILPAGDRTEIGESGVTLSGGQKARISLARAVYQDKEIYLLDDPLAAVDSHVANHLFHQCIMGLLRSKTRILCTHHIKFLRDADVVIVMEDGKIIEAGPPRQVLDEADLESSLHSSTEEYNDIGKSVSADLPASSPADGSLVQEEEKDSGTVKLHVYSSYWRAVGHCLAPAVLLALLLMQGSRNVNDWWLSYWVSHSRAHGSQNQSASYSSSSSSSAAAASVMHVSPELMQMSVPLVNVGHQESTVPLGNVTVAEDNVTFYLTVYGILAGANSFFTLMRAFLFAYGGIVAATKLHIKLLTSILQAPVSFFDITPVGRIINRFSSDLYSIDDSLPFIMNIFLAQLYGLLGTIVITCYGLPWFTILLLPLAVVYLIIQNYYRRTSREVKRITSVTLSPIYAHFSESINGLVTIRAMREMHRFKLENRQRLETNQRAQFAGQVAAQWLNLRLQLIGVACVSGIGFIAVLQHHFQTVNPGLVGLAVSYALSITNLLNGVVTSFTETEKQMVSVERAAQYIENIPHERKHSILTAPPFWPIQGAVTFQRVVLQYRAGLPNALNGVSFETQPAEKLGVVGRTGSGKSSLLLALFRMVELKSGQVLIDGINITHLGLKDLRSRLAIIPQDPFLFSGSVRDNLDPTSLYTESHLWTVLGRCHLRDAVTRMGGLEADVGEKGRCFSVGQKQLLCLARAMLTRAKVLCIDEATASVDLHTDSLIQQTIREEFQNNTVITIAHRINTVMDCDRVLVMSQGKVAEYGPPAELMQNQNSQFYGLVNSLQ